MGGELCPAGPHGKPRLRRSFALSAPGLPAPPPIVLELVLKTKQKGDLNSGGMPTTQNLPAMRFGTSEDGFVNLAIRVLLHHRA